MISNRGLHEKRALRWVLVVLAVACLETSVAWAQLPANIVEELKKLGQVVEPGCTAKLIRPLMPKNDYNSYWPVDAAAPKRTLLYRGVTLARDVQFGPEPKDLVDIFTADTGAASRTVLVYVPGGAGNKIEQQAVEANAFYDNIGRWAAENGMVGVTMQRGGTAAGQNIAVLVEWLQQNAAKYKGNPNRMFIWAHSAGNGPLGQYIGRPDLYGLGVKGAIFMSGNPVNFGGGGAGGGRGAAAPAAGVQGGGLAATQPGNANPSAPAAGGRGGNAAAAAGGRGGGTIGTSGCTNTAGAGSQAGVIRGPSSQLADQGKEAAARRKELAGSSPWQWTGKQWIGTGAISAPPAADAAGARGGGGGRGGRGAGAAGPQVGAAPGAGPGAAAGAQAPQPNPLILGFQTTRAAILLARAELDPGVNGAMLPSDIAIHDELCKLDGPKAKDGVGHCPTMLYLKGQSHMSEVFSIGSIDKSVSGPILEWIKKVQ